jgi:hypothetical protein
MKTISEYQQKAIKFLKSTNTQFNAEFLRFGKYFSDDKEGRDIYKITLTRGNRVYSFEFGQSINKSGEYKVAKHLENKIWCEQTTGGKKSLTANEFKKLKYIQGIERDILKNENFSAPNEYDVLACLTKYDPGSFENFCSDFGYDVDSRKAEKIYLAVKDEYLNVTRLFNDEEIQILLEIN